MVEAINGLVRALIPSLSRSLREPFGIFRVMHHGTHEKQLSNVFAWLLTPEASHGLNDAFQEIFIAQVNAQLAESEPLPANEWAVRQEVDTSLADEPGKDIADIVLSSPRASVVIENFATSDGHGHDYQRYLDYGARGGRRSVVVLLCERRVAHLQTNGWERAAVVTYAELIAALKSRVDCDAQWKRLHPQQHFFLDELARHFVEAPMEIREDEQLAFIRTMCETGEADRFGHRPIEGASQVFADLLASHAKRQFDDARGLLQRVKSSLRAYSKTVLVDQLNRSLGSASFGSVAANYQGAWEWSVILRRAEPLPKIVLEFGPTAAKSSQALPPTARPDFMKVLIVMPRAAAGLTFEAEQLLLTDVTLSEVLAGLSADDTRLRDGILALLNDVHTQSESSPRPTD